MTAAMRYVFIVLFIFKVTGICQCDYGSNEIDEPQTTDSLLQSHWDEAIDNSNAEENEIKKDFQGWPIICTETDRPVVCNFVRIKYSRWPMLAAVERRKRQASAVVSAITELPPEATYGRGSEVDSLTSPIPAPQIPSNSLGREDGGTGSVAVPGTTEVTTTQPEAETIDPSLGDVGGDGGDNCNYDIISIIFKCGLNLITSIFGLTDTCCKDVL
ncbi:uncharacterized protein LOC126834772 [Adelges cooleyi]|uniref:uncharacterized protein LOC126834772 n=1 Tax=Adelges cooleyi TaxID=133065 RepID=UPI00218000B7|nr:uncharacterized protein LOC126834772 [Adelges cooleyi]